MQKSLLYRPDIDGLRAAAVLSVVIYHFFPHALRGGFTGVDVFFVISGFLIARIIFTQLSENRFSFLDFYARRIRRIFPALIVVLIATFLFGKIIFFDHEFLILAKHLLASVGFVANFVFWREAGYFDITAELKPLLHLWSLGIEEQFYIAFPFILWFAHKKNWKLLGVVVFLFVLSLLTNLVGINYRRVATFYLPVTRVWELLAGAIVAKLSLCGGGEGYFLIKSMGCVLGIFYLLSVLFF